MIRPTGSRPHAVQLPDNNQMQMGAAPGMGNRPGMMGSMGQQT
jgi:hypothetical protein